MKRTSRRTFLKSSATAVVAGSTWLNHHPLGAEAVSSEEAQAATPLVAMIDVAKVSPAISKYMYGMFLEHLGTLSYRSLWSEVIDDRKFYFPVTSAKQEETPRRVFGRPLRKWVPVGGDEFVVMDPGHAYVGEHSPRIRLEGTILHGIQQSGLTLQKGKVYTGRVALAGAPGTKVEITLAWGTGSSDREAVTVSGLHSGYATFQLKFTPQSDTDEGELQIIGSGGGFFHVGVVSLMPVDNVHGFRGDTTKLLHDLDSGFYRLPGGNFISDYDWRDAIGEPDKRPPTMDYAWNAMQPNDVGIDEFMVLCKLLNVEPYITVNAGLGDADSAAALVQYTNGSVHTPMGALRAKNGHPEPYDIKLWNIGNEMYGFWQIGHTALRYYVLKHNAFARAMRKADPSITLIACGAMPDEMTVTGNARLTTGKVQAEYGSEADWTGGLLARSWGYFEGISEHWYCRSGKRFDLSVGKDDPFSNGSSTTQPNDYGYVPVTEPVLDWARRPSNRVRLKAEAWEEYLNRFPAIRDKKTFLAIDEWAYTGTRPTLRLALSYAMVLHEMFRHTDFINMSAFTFGTSCLDFNGRDAIYNSHGLLFKLYREHFGTLPVEVTGNSPQPSPKWPVGGDQPKVNAGSPTYPLDVAAALKGDRKLLTVGVVNATETPQPLAVSIHGAQLGKSRGWRVTGPHLDAANALGQKPQIGVEESTLPQASTALQVAPISINIYEFEVLGMR
jgi:alpha-N-arabinofuranosidase